MGMKIIHCLFIPNVLRPTVNIFLPTDLFPKGGGAKPCEWGHHLFLDMTVDFGSQEGLGLALTTKYI